MAADTSAKIYTQEEKKLFFDIITEKLAILNKQERGQNVLMPIWEEELVKKGIILNPLYYKQTTRENYGIEKRFVTLFEFFTFVASQVFDYKYGKNLQEMHPSNTALDQMVELVNCIQRHNSYKFKEAASEQRSMFDSFRARIVGTPYEANICNILERAELNSNNMASEDVRKLNDIIQKLEILELELNHLFQNQQLSS